MSVSTRSCSWVMAAAVAVAVVGCGDSETVPSAQQEEATSPEAAAVADVAGARVVATVNGKNIYERDVRYWFERNTQGRRAEPTVEERRNMLEAIISQELILQRATELGLDRNRQYQERVLAKQAELDSLRRTAIRDLFFLHQSRQQPSVSDDEVRRFYDANASWIGKVYHVQHILMRSEAEIGAVRRRIQAGADFEEVANEPYASLPDTANRPWDMGRMSWEQIPEPWRASLSTLEAGAVSDVIAGPNSRFWIIRLVSKEDGPSMSFETAREPVRRILERDAMESLRSNLDESLRRQAQITYPPE